jgi:putative transposase
MTLPPEREEIMHMITEATDSGARLSRACATISLAERTLQRWKKDLHMQCIDRRTTRVQTPKNQLSDAEKNSILALANSAEFADCSPWQIVPRLLDKGEYIASESTIYRLLKAEHQLTHRSAQRPAQPRHKPRALCATAPNSIWSWDITYLPTNVKGIFYYLYLFVDIFSRKIVGWQVYESESAEQASDVLRDICAQEKIVPNQVVLHSDNGSSMKGATMIGMMQQLGVAPSFSRPAVSNDNPYSESLFKTLKYCPHYPRGTFNDLSAARKWVTQFVHWYNHQHRHSAIHFVTPHQRHEGADVALLRQRAALYAAAKARHPERWSGNIRNWQHIDAVHLNPDKQHRSIDLHVT